MLLQIEQFRRHWMKVPPALPTPEDWETRRRIQHNLNVLFGSMPQEPPVSPEDRPDIIA